MNTPLSRQMDQMADAQEWKERADQFMAELENWRSIPAVMRENGFPKIGDTPIAVTASIALLQEKLAELEEVVAGELAYRHTVEAQVVELSAQANQLEREAGAAQDENQRLRAKLDDWASQRDYVERAEAAEADLRVARAALGEIREWRETARSEMAGRRAAEHQNVELTKALAAYEAQVNELEAKLAEAREELEAVLRDWNDLVAAVGSPTNGGAVGHARALRAEVERLREALEQIAGAPKGNLRNPAKIARAALRGKHKEGCCCTGCALRGGGK